MTLPRRTVLAAGGSAVLGVVDVLAVRSALAADEATAPAAEVRIKDNLYSPALVTIKAGTSVRWTNDERRTSHSVLFPAEGGLESERMLPGESWQRRFDRPGRYAYVCGPHPEMKGVVVVTE